jgi:hypothetical protein
LVKAVHSVFREIIVQFNAPITGEHAIVYLLTLATGPFIVAAGGISNIILHSDVQKIELGVDVQLPMSVR